MKAAPLCLLFACLLTPPAAAAPALGQGPTVTRLVQVFTGLETAPRATKRGTFTAEETQELRALGYL